MTLFFLLAALLVLAALALLLAGPLRTRASVERESDLRATNISIARERRAELAAALDDGAIDEASHALESERIERELAAELDALPERAPRDGSVPAMLLVAVFVPIAAGALYLRLGDPGAIVRVAEAASAGNGGGVAGGAAGADGAAAGQAPALSELLPGLEARLASEPDDVDGWRLLGRSYLGIEDFARAEPALRRAIALEEDSATLGQLAEAIAMNRGGELAGEPVTLLERAVELDADAPQGLWLLAIARQQVGEHAAALQLFERLRVVVAEDTDAVATIDGMMARSRTELGEAPREPAERGTALAPSNPAGGETSGATGTGADAADDVAVEGVPATPPADAAPATSVTVRVSLSDEARADARPDETVFVYARASDGPPMPLAVARYTVADLPLEVTLDEGMAMMPAMSLANFPNVTVGARVSPSGDAIGSTGDWFAERANVPVGDGTAVVLTIDARRP